MGGTSVAGMDDTANEARSVARRHGERGSSCGNLRGLVKMGHSSNARESELPMWLSLVVLRLRGRQRAPAVAANDTLFPPVYCYRVESLLSCVLVVFESHGAAGCCSCKISFDRRVR